MPDLKKLLDEAQAAEAAEQEKQTEPNAKPEIKRIALEVRTTVRAGDHTAKGPGEGGL